MNKPSTPTASLMLGYIWRAHQWSLDVADTNGMQYCAQPTTYFNHFLFLEIFLWTSVSSKKRVGLFLILNKKTSLFRKVFLIFFENSTSVSFRLFLVGYNGCIKIPYQVLICVLQPLTKFTSYMSSMEVSCAAIYRKNLR